MTDKMILTPGAIIRDFRREQNLSVRKFADVVNAHLAEPVVFQMWSLWENGVRQPHKNAIALLAAVAPGWIAEMATMVLERMGEIDRE